MRKRLLAIAFVLAAFAVFGVAALSTTVQAAPPAQGELKGDPTHGAYLFALNGGCGCHMGAAGFLAGGDPFEGPFGKVSPPNITSDPETGIGSWTEEDIVRVFREGKKPDGEQLFPIMPYPYFSGLSAQDQHDLAAYIMTAPPIKNQVPARELTIPVPPFEPHPQPAEAPTSGVARGEYIVNTIAHCGDCHTPSNADGSPDLAKFLAGNQVDPDNLALNITPDVETGIGSWSQEQIATELKTGMRPSGVPVSGLMALVIEGGFKDMTMDDAFAIAAYWKSIPAVHNVPGAAAATTLPATGTNPTNALLLGVLLAMGFTLLGAGALVWRSATKRVK